MPIGRDSRHPKPQDYGEIDSNCLFLQEKCRIFESYTVVGIESIIYSSAHSESEALMYVKNQWVADGFGGTLPQTVITGG